jgi:hypothetical protein
MTSPVGVRRRCCQQRRRDRGGDQKGLEAHHGFHSCVSISWQRMWAWSVLSQPRHIFVDRKYESAHNRERRAEAGCKPKPPKIPASVSTLIDCCIAAEIGPAALDFPY